MASTAAVASGSKKVVAAVEDETAAPADTHVPLAGVAPTGERSGGPNSDPAPTTATPASTPASHRAETPEPLAESQPKAAAPPLTEISLQVNQPGSNRIDVRVVQTGSEVHVSVHSGDATLTSGLRSGLSDLQSRLEENGYRSEMWRPGVAATTVPAMSGGQAATNFSRNSDGQSQQQGGSQQESGRRNQNQSNQPHWVEEMESSLNGGEKSSGGFYGFSS
jgi:hypothetical protein